MSKIIEALKVRSSQAPKEPSSSQPKELRVEKSPREMTQEQLAEIYFSGTGKPKPADPPIIVRVMEKPTLASYVPWIIACVAFMIAALSLFTTKRIFIDVKVLDEKSAQLHGFGPRSEESSSPVDAQQEEMASNKIPVQNFTFEGAAYLNSSKDKSGTLTLINSSLAPFARASLRLDPPLDVSRAKIIFYAKGGRGGENVAFALKDADNVQGFYKGKQYPFPDRLTTAWQKAEILVTEETAKDFDARTVTSLRFEFGSKDTGNKPGDIVMIKDLQWVPV